MRPQTRRKIIALEDVAALAAEQRSLGRSVVLCHGCFDIVHPGHLRYLQFAGRQGDVLVVSLTGDDAIEKGDGMRPAVPQELRAENLAALEFVDRVVVVEGPTAEPVIRSLQPDCYVKGREYEHSRDPGFLAERSLVESLGGRVMLSSGDVVMSSTTILENTPGASASVGGMVTRAEGTSGAGEAARAGSEAGEEHLSILCRRWGIDGDRVTDLLDRRMVGLRVAVVGDSLCDRYTFCEQADVANEAPVLSVSPSEQADYLGGAAIIAAHLRGLGAEPTLLTTLADAGGDRASAQLLETLDRLGIEHESPSTRSSLPLKQRFLVDGQKVLKVNRGEPQPLDRLTQDRFADRLLAGDWDAVIFTDFGYGTLTLGLLESVLPRLRVRAGILAGDTSGPRRTLLGLHGADLLTPTEKELRGVAGDFEQSLPSVAGRVMQQLRCPNLAVTMGARGVVLFRPREAEPEQWFRSRLRSDYLPSLADRVEDVVGAGDVLLATTTLAMAAGADLTTAAYLGSAAASLAVSQIGNVPIDGESLRRHLCRRPELAPSLRATPTGDPALSPGGGLRLDAA